jgi:hypothetical protein
MVSLMAQKRRSGSRAEALRRKIRAQESSLSRGLPSVERVAKSEPQTEEALQAERVAQALKRKREGRKSASTE